MIKILHILNTGTFSGAENVAITIIESLESKCLCAYASLEGEIEHVLKDRNIHYLPNKRLSVKAISSMIAEFNPDIIHAHDFNASIKSVLTCTKTPVISHLHNNPPWIKKFNLRTIAYMIATFKFKKIFTVSNAIQKEFFLSNIFKGKIKMVSNPISVEFVKKKASLEDVDGFDVIFLGRLDTPKNPQRFIRIIEQLINSNLDIKAALIGDGMLKYECQCLINNLKLSDRIFILGFKENPYPYVKKSKVLCITSDWEGFGLVATEALSLGVPVLATPVGGLVEIVTTQCGMLCKDDNDFVSEAQKLLVDRNYWLKKSDGAVRRGNQLNNIEEYAKEMNDVYEECLEC